MSSQKRELQRIKKEKAIRKAKAKKSLAGLGIGLVVVALLVVVGYVVYYKTVVTTPAIKNYSKGLNDDGTITGVTATDYVVLGDLQEMEVQYSDYAPEAETIDTKIAALLQERQEYYTDTDVVVAMNDTILVRYVGKVDGEEFEGGNTGDGGTIITVGQAGYIDGFEEQLVGHNIGESFDIEVTFPEDYSTTELAGKDAVFSITLMGIYYTPEFNDAFVETYFSDIALTADAYRAYLEEQEVNAALETYVQEYSLEVCTVNAYPPKYVEKVMGTLKYADIVEMEGWNQVCEAYGIETYSTVYEYKLSEELETSNSLETYSTVYDYKQLEMEYEASLRLRAEEVVESNLIIQAIYEDAGLTITSEHLDATMEEMGTTPENLEQMIETYGEGYIYQRAMKVAVVEYLVGNVTVNK